MANVNMRLSFEHPSHDSVLFQVIEWIDTVGMTYLEKPVELAESYGQAISQHNNLEKFIGPAKVCKMQDIY